MNNNLYQWHDERMVNMEMQALQREVAQANLFKEAGFSKTSWLTRSISALLNVLRARGPKPQDHQSIERQSYSSRTEESV